MTDVVGVGGCAGRGHGVDVVPCRVRHWVLVVAIEALRLLLVVGWTHLVVGLGLEGGLVGVVEDACFGCCGGVVGRALVVESHLGGVVGGGVGCGTVGGRGSGCGVVEWVVQLPLLWLHPKVQVLQEMHIVVVDRTRDVMVGLEVHGVEGQLGGARHRQVLGGLLLVRKTRDVVHAAVHLLVVDLILIVTPVRDGLCGSG